MADLTNQETTENKIKESEDIINALHKLLDVSGDFIFVKDLFGHYVQVNNAFANAYPGLQFIGKTDDELFDNVHDESYGSHYRQSSNDIKETRTFERTLKYKDISRTLLITKTPQLDSGGQISGFYGLGKDITSYKATLDSLNTFEKQKLMEEQQQAIDASKTKSDFLARMSHEIRTPLNGIVGMSQLLLQTPLNEEQFEYADNIKKSTEYLTLIINDILDISKIEAGKITLEYVDVNLPQFLNAIKQMFYKQMEQKGLQFYLRHPTINPWIKTDPTRLMQIINNLISNALKFTKKGQIELAVDFTAEMKHIRFRVIDTGIGIGKAERTELFKPFTQLDISTTRKYGGSGLGLSIAKSLTELLGGTIGVESEGDQKGSEFWFEIPYIKGQYVDLTVNDLVPSHSDINTILVAEDNIINRKIIVKQLEKLGFSSHGVENGAEAVEELKSNSQKYLLALFDCNMPIMDGYEATAKVRQLGIKLPIIAMTADVSLGTREKCLACGMNDYMSKPFDKHHLIEIIAKYQKFQAS